MKKEKMKINAVKRIKSKQNIFKKKIRETRKVTIYIEQKKKMRTKF